MMRVLTSVLLASTAIFLPVSAGRFLDLVHGRSARHEIAAENAQLRKLESRGGNKGRFLTNATLPYKIDSLPNVDFDIGEMYSGSIPIGTNKSETLFFVFSPTIGEPVDEVTIWVNGGPGCSSLEGFFQENGRFTWRPGTYAPVENPYSWVNLTNMLWVDQPIGTGFATGTPKATTQEETAQDFVHFFKTFEDLFGIKNYKIYVTGESYAGRYVPYISAAMLDQNDKEYFDLSGALAYDPCIGQFDYVQQEAPVVPFVVQNNNLFNFNQSFLDELESLQESCGYAAYIDQYLQFPPSGVQPPKSFNYTSEAACDVFDIINLAAFDPNPCFDIYEIPTMCPLLWDVLAFPTELIYQAEGASVYFNRSDVKKAMHAPESVTWSECSVEPVFVGGDGGPEQEGDLSANPIEKVLPQVIEATNRVLIGNGDYGLDNCMSWTTAHSVSRSINTRSSHDSSDMVIITNGTLISIQNMTWNGALGFAFAPSTPIIITEPDLEYQALFVENGAVGWDGPQGIMGIQHYERGLMWVETYQSGHMQPEYQPRTSYRHISWLLGRTDVI